MLHFKLGFLFQELEAHGILEIDAHEFVERFGPGHPRMFAKNNEERILSWHQTIMCIASMSGCAR